MSADREMDVAEDQSGNLLAHLPAIIRQRYIFLVVPVILCTIAGIATAFLLPQVYRSTATLLVESPQLPDDVIGAQDGDVVDQRIAKMRQQVLSRPRLIELIQKHRLYAEERASKPLSEIIEKMRSSTNIRTVSAEIQRAANGRSSTIAFELSFDYKAGAPAQAVAQDMTEQILLLDATKNSEQANNTVQFLTDQATALQTQIAELETSIETIKAENGLALSNAGSMFMGGMGGSYDAQIIALQRDNVILAAQKEARASASERYPIVAGAESDLAAAQARYSENHPDIAIAKRRLAQARKLAESNFAKLPPDTIDQQIASNNSQIAALQAMRAQESNRLSTAQNAQAIAPLVQERIAQQQQKLEALNAQYGSVSDRLLAAQASAKAESEQKGERLSVIDPPVAPEKPNSPNRPLLMAGGVAFGFGLGLFLILAAELYFRPIRDSLEIRAITGSVPMVTIPTIATGESEQKRWYRALFSRLNIIRRSNSSAET